MKMKEFTDTELEQEQWRDIDGYDGMYQVSDIGRVRSLKYGKVRVLRARKNSGGYLQVNLCKNCVGNNIFVHRLVANAFIPNSDETKTQINHKNEVKTDNRVENLEWCTAKYNITYNDLHRRRKHYIHHQPKRDKIKPLYRQDLSISENIEMFKENGISCSPVTLWYLRRDLGLTKPYKQRKPKQI